MEEIWRAFPSENSTYSISNLGNAKSFSTRHNGRLLKKRISKHGYVKYTLFLNGQQQTFSAHRMVAISFIENNSDRPYVNHIDGNKQNNLVYNLEWCTPSENTKHAFDSGLIKITEDQKEAHRINRMGKFGKEAISSKALIDTTTGSTYNSLHEASAALGIKYKTLSAQLTGQNKNKTTLKFI